MMLLCSIIWKSEKIKKGFLKKRSKCSCASFSPTNQTCRGCDRVSRGQSGTRLPAHSWLARFIIPSLLKFFFFFLPQYILHHIASLCISLQKYAATLLYVPCASFFFYLPQHLGFISLFNSSPSSPLFFFPIDDDSTGLEISSFFFSLKFRVWVTYFFCLDRLKFVLCENLIF